MNNICNHYISTKCIPDYITMTHIRANEIKNGQNCSTNRLFTNSISTSYSFSSNNGIGIGKHKSKGESRNRRRRTSEIILSLSQNSGENDTAGLLFSDIDDEYDYSSSDSDAPFAIEETQEIDVQINDNINKTVNRQYYNPYILFGKWKIPNLPINASILSEGSIIHTIFEHGMDDSFLNSNSIRNNNGDKCVIVVKNENKLKKLPWYSKYRRDLKYKHLFDLVETNLVKIPPIYRKITKKNRKNYSQYSTYSKSVSKKSQKSNVCSMTKPHSNEKIPATNFDLFSPINSTIDYETKSTDDSNQTQNKNENKNKNERGDENENQDEDDLLSPPPNKRRRLSKASNTSNNSSNSHKSSNATNENNAMLIDDDDIDDYDQAAKICEIFILDSKLDLLQCNEYFTVVSQYSNSSKKCKIWIINSTNNSIEGYLTFRGRARTISLRGHYLAVAGSNTDTNGHINRNNGLHNNRGSNNDVGGRVALWKIGNETSETNENRENSQSRNNDESANENDGDDKSDDNKRHIDTLAELTVSSEILDIDFDIGLNYLLFMTNSDHLCLWHLQLRQSKCFCAHNLDGFKAKIVKISDIGDQSHSQSGSRINSDSDSISNSVSSSNSTSNIDDEDTKDEKENSNAFNNTLIVIASNTQLNLLNFNNVVQSPPTGADKRQIIPLFDDISGYDSLPKMKRPPTPQVKSHLRLKSKTNHVNSIQDKRLQSRLARRTYKNNNNNNDDCWKLWKEERPPFNKMIPFENGLVYCCHQSSVLNIVYFGKEKDLDKNQQYNPKSREYGHCINLNMPIRENSNGNNNSDEKIDNKTIEQEILSNTTPYCQFIKNIDVSYNPSIGRFLLAAPSNQIMNEMNVESFYQKSFQFNSNILSIDTSTIETKYENNTIIIVLTQNLMLYLITSRGVFIKKLSLVSLQQRLNNDCKYDQDCHLIEMGLDQINNTVWVLLQQKYLFNFPFESSNQ